MGITNLPVDDAIGKRSSGAATSNAGVAGRASRDDPPLRLWRIGGSAGGAPLAGTTIDRGGCWEGGDDSCCSCRLMPAAIAAGAAMNEEEWMVAEVGSSGLAARSRGAEGSDC